MALCQGSKICSTTALLRVSQGNEVMVSWIRVFYYRLMASLRSRVVYPDDIDIDTRAFFERPVSLKIAVIDDNEFPWVDTLESKGHSVSVFNDYHKTSTKASQKKLQSYKLHSYDIVFCDIEGVGLLAYPGLEGVGVIQDLRELNPLQVIVAFTGSPARLLDPKTGKNYTAIDSIFQRDWELEDFLLNFNSLTKIFAAPKQRWKFLRVRLVHLDFSESKITMIQRAFTANLLFLKYLGERTNIPKSEIKQIILDSEKRVDVKGVVDTAAVAVKAVNIVSSVFFVDALK